MATNPTIAHASQDNSIKKVSWTLTTAAGDGAWVKFNEYRDRCISVSGHVRRRHCGAARLQ